MRIVWLSFASWLQFVEEGFLLVLIVFFNQLLLLAVILNSEALFAYLNFVVGNLVILWDVREVVVHAPVHGFVCPDRQQDVANLGCLWVESVVLYGLRRSFHVLPQGQLALV